MGLSGNELSDRGLHSEFQNQLMPKWAHSRSKEEVFQFAVTRITSN